MNEENTINGLGKKAEENLVQKCKNLLSLSKTEITLSEFKIMDTYLSRIDSHNPDEREVVFKKGEIEKLLGVQRIRSEELELRLRHLMSNIVKVEDKTKKKGFKLITLFERAETIKEDDDSWTVILKCTESAMEYIFNIDEIGYIRYKLKSIINLRSRYSYIMFHYLENNRFRKKWIVSLEELKEILNCNEPVYDTYKRFNDKILKPCKKEIEENTGCRYTYKALKTGRKVDRIEFELETLNELTDNLEPPELPAKYDDNMFLWRHAVEPLELELTEEQIDELDSIILTIPSYKLPEIDGVGMDDLDFRRFHYIDRIVKTIIRRDSEKKIKNRYNYLLQILKNEADS